MNYGVDIVTYDWGTEQIDFSNSRYQGIVQMLPVEIHHKADGSLIDGPTLAIVMSVPGMDDCAVVGQISVKMLNECLARLGYQITGMTLLN